LRQIALIACAYTILGMGAVTLAFPGNFVVIVHQGNPVKSFSTQRLKRIFLGEELFWEDGRRILPAGMSDEASATKDFINEIVELSVDGYTAQWRRKLFSGRAIPPRRVDRIDEMIEFVERNPAAIGFVPAGGLPGGRSARPVAVTVE